MSNQNNLVDEAAVQFANARKMQAITLSPYLQKLQRRTALVTILTPFIGTLVTFYSLSFMPPSLATIWLTFSCYLLTMIGITVGYHRLAAHNSFHTNTIIKCVLIILGSMAAQGPVIHWVSNHRRHHAFSDKPGDVHSPNLFSGQKWAKLRGLWHAHIQWMFGNEVSNATFYAQNLLKDPVVVKLNKLYLLWVLLGLALPTAIAWYLCQTWTGALEGFLWAGLFRVFLVHNITWSVNSITHSFGSREYHTSDHSVNNVLIALLSAGEGWHNSHHAFPYSARFGLKFWQLDLGYITIFLLKLTHLASQVRLPTQTNPIIVKHSNTTKLE